MLKYECVTVRGKLNCFTLDITRDTGILGQRDSGKEEIINATFKLTKADGKIFLDETDVLEKGEELFWTKLAVVFYDTMKLFNPIYDVASHFIEIGISHELENEELIIESAKEILKILGVKDDVLTYYPYQLRPLELKKVGIALASFLEPEYLFIDDVEYNLSEAEIINIVNSIIDLQDTFNMKLIVFDNDPAVLSRLTDYFVTLYKGEIVEEGFDVLEYPLHPYTADLLNRNLKEQSFVGKGCVYSLNCEYSSYKCKTVTPKLVDLGGRKVKCLGFPW